MRLASLSTFVLAAFLLSGCAGPEPKPRGSTPPTVTASSVEPSTIQRSLADERAKSASLELQVETLQQKIDSESKNSNLQRAELDAYKSRVEQLTRKNAELVSAAESPAKAPLTRPDVSATPLTPETDRALAAFAASRQDRVAYDRGRGAVSFTSDLLFDSGRDVLQPEARTLLAEFARILAPATAGDFDCVVVGHTDSAAIRQSETAAAHPTNWHLSVHRAIAVKDVLVSGGLSDARVGVMGYGPNRPAGSDRAANRRVEIYLVPRGQVRSFEPIRGR